MLPAAQLKSAWPQPPCPKMVTMAPALVPGRPGVVLFEPHSQSLVMSIRPNKLPFVHE
jgi:hypothetical protein